MQGAGRNSITVFNGPSIDNKENASMEQINRSDFPPERVQRLVSGIPFFNEVMRNDPQQFDKLMELCEILEARPGESVIRRGDTDTFLYFLLRGQLAVMAPGEEDQGRVINYVSPGEVFGTLAMIREIPRSATLRVDDAAQEAIVARLDYVFFKNLQDFSTFSLETKLAFYRMVVHNIRWTLEVNKMQEPDHALVGNLRKVPIFTGAKGTMEELESLHEQGNMLAEILCEWNQMPQQPANVQFT
jgi:CRP/FNR family cyclic AMP-dependent transcriptional regulator